MGDHQPMSMGIARLAAAGCLTVLIPVASPVAAAPPYDFNDAAYLAPASSLPDWADTVARNEVEQQIIAECLTEETACHSRLKGIRHLLLKAQKLPREKQIRLINRYVNKRRYRDDRREYRVSSISNRKAVIRNNWSTVLDFVRRGGDCEDYATTKYFLLRELGLAADSMRVVVGYDRSEPFSIYFNPDYIGDCLKVLHCEGVKMEFTDSARQAVLRDGDGLSYVLMPVTPNAA